MIAVLCSGRRSPCREGHSTGAQAEPEHQRSQVEVIQHGGESTSAPALGDVAVEEEAHADVQCLRGTDDRLDADGNEVLHRYAVTASRQWPADDGRVSGVERDGEVRIRWTSRPKSQTRPPRENPPGLAAQ